MNNTLSEGPQPQPLYAVIFSCILALGLLLNGMSLWILHRNHSLRSCCVIYMINLAISDLFLVISLPMRVYFYATATWPLGALACNLITMLFRNNIRSSALFITLISVDRLLAVVYPLRSRHLRTASKAWKAAALVWLFVVILNIPEGLNFSRSQKNGTESTCFEDVNHQSNHRTARLYIQPVVVFSMLAVNIVCTALVSWTLNRHLNVSEMANNKVKAMLIFVMNLVMFTMCFLPLSVALLVTTTPEVIRPLICLASVNCCLDPLLYYFSLDAFWKKKNVDIPRQC